MEHEQNAHVDAQAQEPQPQAQEPSQSVGRRRFRLQDAPVSPAPEMEFEVAKSWPDGSVTTETVVYEMLDPDSLALLDEAKIAILDGTVAEDQQGIGSMMDILRQQVRIIFREQLPEGVVAALKFNEMQYIIQSFGNALQGAVEVSQRQVRQANNRQRKRNNRKRSR